MTFLPDWLRTKIIQFLVSRAGKYAATAINAAIASAITAGLVFAGTTLAHFDSRLAVMVSEILRDIDQVKLAGAVWIVLNSLVHYATVRWLTKDAKVIQDALNRDGAKLEVDGWIGEKSVQAFASSTGIPIRKPIPN